MSKLLILASLLCITILSAGTALFPNSAAFWLAGDVPAYQYVRVALAAVLLLQLCTKPPRRILFRVVAGTLAVAVAVWALETTYANHMQFLDMLSILAASFSITISALEIQPKPRQSASEFVEQHPSVSAG